MSRTIRRHGHHSIVLQRSLPLHLVVMITHQADDYGEVGTVRHQNTLKEMEGEVPLAHLVLHPSHGDHTASLRRDVASSSDLEHGRCRM
jgi:hypothetical protein